MWFPCEWIHGSTGGKAGNPGRLLDRFALEQGIFSGQVKEPCPSSFINCLHAWTATRPQGRRTKTIKKKIQGPRYNLQKKAGM